MNSLTAAEKRFQQTAVLIGAQRVIFARLLESGVTIRSLSELADTTSGGTPDRRNPTYYGGDVPWLKSGELTDGLVTEIEETISNEGLENSAAKVIREGTLLIALYGATVGKTGILGRAAATNQAVCAITPRDKSIRTSYLHWFFRYKREDFLRDSFGGAQPNISQRLLRETLVPVPPPKLQANITEFLSAVEFRMRGGTVELPDLLPPLTEQRRIVARIEELAAQIQEARGLREAASTEVKALVKSTATAAMVNVWPHKALEDLCSIITDGTHLTPRYVDEGAMFLSAQNVKPFRFMPEKHRKVSLEDFKNYTARNKPTKGDVLLTRVGAGIGEAAVIDQDVEFAIYVSLALIRTKPERLLAEFLVHWLNSPAGQAHCKRDTLGRGHSQGNLNLNLLRGFQIPTPPLAEQGRIVAELNALHAQMDALQKLQAETASQLDALLPSILDKAFKGEL